MLNYRKTTHYIMRPRSILMHFVLFFCLSMSGYAQYNRSATLEKLAREMSDSLAFEGVMMVAERGRELLTFTEGMASHEFSVLNRRETKFRIASITKMMTSYAIFILKSQKKLALDQPISSFFPELKEDITAKVTVEHLLKHRSGLLRDFEVLSEKSTTGLTSPKELIALLNNTELAYEPGTSYSYSNVGYTLLGLIISEIMQQPYGEAMHTLLFAPLGMQFTGHEVFDAIVENKATGYDRLYNEIVKAKSGYSSHVLGAGSLYSNAPDLLKFSEEIQQGSLLSKEDREWYLKDDGSFQTAGGWVTWQYGSRLEGSPENGQIIMHGGSTSGYRSVIAIFLNHGITVIALSNQTPMSYSLYYNKLGNATLGYPKEEVREPQLEKLLPFILEGNLETAEHVYQQNLIKEPNTEKIKPSEINSYGYSFLEHARTKDALKIFRFAIRLFPENANAYDSLGEALLKDNQIEEAVAMYEKSLELNPENQGAVEVLKRLSSGKK